MFKTEIFQRVSRIFLLGVFFIALWQSFFIIRSTPITDAYRDKSASGLHLENYERSYLVSFQGVDAHTVNVVAFLLALLCLWAAFCWVEKFLLGAMTILFLGSNPFQLFEIYRNSNNSGWPIALSIFILALCIPLIYRKCSLAYWYFFFILGAVLIGSVAHSEYPTHKSWHSLFLGFSDFDTTYGHQWNDAQAYEVANEVLSENSGNYPSEYYALMKKLVFTRVFEHPIWFSEIILKRVVRIFTETTPLSIQVWSARVSIAWPGWVWLLVVMLAVQRRRKEDLALLLFTLPVSLTALLVYSGDGRSYYSIYHIFAAPVLLSYLIEKITEKVPFLRLNRVRASLFGLGAFYKPLHRLLCFFWF